MIHSHVHLLLDLCTCFYVLKSGGGVCAKFFSEIPPFYVVHLLKRHSRLCVVVLKYLTLVLICILFITKEIEHIFLNFVLH